MRWHHYTATYRNGLAYFSAPSKRKAKKLAKVLMLDDGPLESLEKEELVFNNWFFDIFTPRYRHAKKK